MWFPHATKRWLPKLLVTTPWATQDTCPRGSWKFPHYWISPMLRTHALRCQYLVNLFFQNLGCFIFFSANHLYCCSSSVAYCFFVFNMLFLPFILIWPALSLRFSIRVTLFMIWWTASFVLFSLPCWLCRHCFDQTMNEIWKLTQGLSIICKSKCKGVLQDLQCGIFAVFR